MSADEEVGTLAHGGIATGAISRATTVAMMRDRRALCYRRDIVRRRPAVR
jgi:hypothetical protein